MLATQRVRRARVTPVAAGHGSGRRLGLGTYRATVPEFPGDNGAGAAAALG